VTYYAHQFCDFIITILELREATEHRIGLPQHHDHDDEPRSPVLPRDDDKFRTELIQPSVPGRCVQRETGDQFLPRCMECRRGLAMRILLSVCLSVRLSVCQTRGL